MEKIYIDLIKEHLENLPSIKKVLTESWLQEKFSEIKPTAKIIWMLTSNNLNPAYHIVYNLERNLNQIEFEKLDSERRDSIANKLRSDDEKDVIGVISEIDIFVFFKRNNIPAVYEPKIEGHNKKVDFSIKINDEDILIEVSALNIGEDDKNMNNPIDEFVAKMRKIKAPFLLSVGFKENFSRQNIKELFNYSHKLLQEAKSVELENPLPYVTNIRLKEYPNHEGQVMVGTHHAGVRNDQSRVRKLLRRESEQLSKNHKNILIVNLHSYADDIDFGNALLGDEQLTLAIPKDPNSRDVKVFPTRSKSNRFLDENFNRRVNLVIGYKHIFDSKKWGALHKNPYKSFTKTEIDTLAKLLN